MVATFVIEVALLVYVLVRYHMNSATRLIVAALGSLGLFQLSEYYVCGGMGADAATWSRVGFVAITALPPIGLHLLHVLAGKPVGKLVAGAYVSMLAFMTYFALSPTAFVGNECTGNYVIFQIGVDAARIYGLYYYGWLLAALLIGWRWITATKTTKKIKPQIGALMIGYLVFLVPTGIANTVKPETRAGIPSIMCGFAVLFALILALYIAPRASELRSKYSLPVIRK